MYKILGILVTFFLTLQEGQTVARLREELKMAEASQSSYRLCTNWKENSQQVKYYLKPNTKKEYEVYIITSKLENYNLVMT